MNKIKIFQSCDSYIKLQEEITNFINRGYYVERKLINVSLSTHIMGYDTYYYAAVIYSEKENS